MKPNISESSYGYALTEELIKGYGSSITTAPVFPSLYQEGKEGGGWDVKLEKGGIPLFIQFKLSHYMKNASAKERKSGHFASQYYRMHIRPINHSKQHELLLDLERKGNEVYYSAPGFHEPSELNDAYLNNKVRDRSIWIKPTDIGNITDIDKHYVAFQLPATWYFCSKPRKLEQDLSFSSFLQNITSTLSRKKELALTRESLNKLAENLTHISKKRTESFWGDEKDTFSEDVLKVTRILSNRHPIELISYYASIYLDLQLFIVQENCA